MATIFFHRKSYITLTIAQFSRSGWEGKDMRSGAIEAQGKDIYASMRARMEEAEKHWRWVVVLKPRLKDSESRSK